MKSIKTLNFIPYTLFICFITLFLTGCTQNDISSDELKNTQWLGYSISGWRMEEGVKKNVSQNLGENSGRFDLSFNGSNYIWNISSLAGIPNRNELGTWSKTDQNILLTSTSGQNTILVVKEVVRDLTDQLTLVWSGPDFEYTIKMKTR